MTQLDLELQMCKKSFKFFIGYCFWHMYKTKFMFYDFHNELIDILLGIKSTPRAVINAPPRIGKTEIIKLYIAWLFLLNPSSSVIYVSYEERLVARKNREIKELLIWLANRFGIDDLRMNTQAQGKTEWINKANGTILARGSNNGLTGAGCSTLLVLDDPNKPNDRSSPNVLESRNRTFVNTVRNRINHPDVPILVIQQRIAANDLSGFLLAGGSNEPWTHFNFPAIKDDGGALCPERLPISEIETYRNDPFTYNAQYLQVPLDDIGKLFDKNKLVVSEHRPPLSALRLVIAVDTSGKGEIGNDFNAIAVIGTDGINYYIIEVQNFKADITELLNKVRQTRMRYGQDVPVLFEARANGSAAVQFLRKEMSGILEVHPQQSKVERALVVKVLFDSLNVHFTLRGLVWGEVLNQFMAFPHCKHDDIVDAVVHGITWLMQLPIRKAPPTTTQNPPTRQDSTLRRKVYGGSRGNFRYNSSRGR